MKGIILNDRLSTNFNHIDRYFNYFLLLCTILSGSCQQKIFKICIEITANINFIYVILCVINALLFTSLVFTYLLVIFFSMLIKNSSSIKFLMNLFCYFVECAIDCDRQNQYMAQIYVLTFNIVRISDLFFKTFSV